MKNTLTERDLDFVQSHLKRKLNAEELNFLDSVSKSVSAIKEKAVSLGSETNLLPIKTICTDVEIYIGLEHAKSVFHSNRNADLFLMESHSKLELESGGVKFALGIREGFSNVNAKRNFANSLLFLVNGKRAIQALSKIGKDLPIQFSHPVYKSGLGFAIFEITRHYRCGIKISTKSYENSLKLHQNRSDGLILAVRESDVRNYKRKISAKKINTESIGSLLKDSRIDIVLSKKNTIHLPLTVFGFLKSDYRDAAIVSFSPTSQQQHYPAVQKNYNSAALTLGKVRRKKGILFRPKKSQISSSIAAVSIQSRQNLLYVKNKVFTIPQQNFDEHMPAGIVANATRELSAMGLKPAGLALAVGTKDVPHPSLPKLFDSVSYSCRQLHIPLQNRLIYSHNKKGFELNVSIIGIGKNPEENIGKKFVNSSDFIIMLGSLKGELGNSEFFKLKGKSFSGNFPAVDLSTEFRLQEVLQLGAEGKLIHSAVSIGKGGLAVSLIQSLRESSSEIGSKIYLNSKLRPDEILFGESQGVALVTVAESDLMDFERICMQRGIPSTTVGRVTDDKGFLFNDWIKLTRDKIK